MHNVWGGMRLQPYSQENKDVLVNGHTYIVKWHVKGKSTNASTTVGWSNNMGWSGGISEGNKFSIYKDGDILSNNFIEV